MLGNSRQVLSVVGDVRSILGVLLDCQLPCTLLRSNLRGYRRSVWGNDQGSVICNIFFAMQSPSGRVTCAHEVERLSYT